MTKVTLPKRGLYAITGHFTSLNQLIKKMELAILGGAVMIQYRDKKSLPAERKKIAEALLTLCNRHSVPLIINDDIELAKRVGAHGVHLGKEDCDLVTARTTLAANAVIGVSCYDSIETAIEAQKNGASYVAFGRFFPSKSKPNAPTARLETLIQAQQHISIPITAIGGITADNCPQLLSAGAELLAVIDSVFNRPQPDKAAAAIAHCFRKTENR